MHTLPVDLPGREYKIEINEIASERFEWTSNTHAMYDEIDHQAQKELEEKTLEKARNC